MKKKLAVFFSGETLWRRLPAALLCRVDLPGKGIRYTADALFGIPGQKDMITIEENIRQTLSYVRGRIKEKDLASYDEILFCVKKSGNGICRMACGCTGKGKTCKTGNDPSYLYDTA